MSMDFLEADRGAAWWRPPNVASSAERRWRCKPWLMRARLPWRAPTIGIAAGVAATLAASAIAATLTLPASHKRTNAGTAPANTVRSYTAAGAVPTGFQPESFTAITEFAWWLLGQARACVRYTCTSTVVQTINGGSTFIAHSGTADGRRSSTSASRTLALMDTRTGSSSRGDDRCRAQRRQPAGRMCRYVVARVNDLDIADEGLVYAIVISGTGRSSLLRSAVSGDDWSALSGLGHGQLSGLWIEGSDQDRPIGVRDGGLFQPYQLKRPWRPFLPASAVSGTPATARL